MTLTHLVLASPLNTITGASLITISAAEVFFFKSGNTMEYNAVDPTLGQQVQSRLSRTSLNHRYVLLFSLLWNLILWQSDLEWLSQRKAIGFLENVIHLKGSVWGVDILATYILYRGVAPFGNLVS